MFDETPKISIIMPVYLGNYNGAATKRKEKFIRAVNSFIKNTYYNKELIIISDKCDISEKIYNENFKSYDNIIFSKLKVKSQTHSGITRTQGIKKSSGKIISYLDSDDFIGISHLESLVGAFVHSEKDWAYYNDYIHFGSGNSQMRNVVIKHGSIGTSSICHKSSLNVDWDNCNGYGHDWLFINKLKEKSINYCKLFGMSYYVCHIPNVLDV
jgi:glycosyltransferase involved in cell wall biosynthesis